MYLVYESENGKYFVVKDGIESSKYDYIYALTYSPDSKSFSYTATMNGKGLIIKDGVELAKYDSVGNPTYSPDSKSFSYTTRLGTKALVIKDGIVSQEYDDIGNLTYSSDGKSFAFIKFSCYRYGAKLCRQQSLCIFKCQVYFSKTAGTTSFGTVKDQAIQILTS